MLVTPGQKRLGERRAFFLITNRTSTGKPADKGGPPDTADHNNREPGYTPVHSRRGVPLRAASVPATNPKATTGAIPGPPQ